MVILSLPSANSNKKIKSNGTKPHFVFLLLTGLEANFRKWRKRQVRSTVERIHRPPEELFHTRQKIPIFVGAVRVKRAHNENGLNQGFFHGPQDSSSQKPRIHCPMIFENILIFVFNCKPNIFLNLNE